MILAGGAARRLGGVDKMLIEVGDARLIDRAIGAAMSAQQIVVVGPPRPVRTHVSWIRETPPGGGPVAALAAGLTLVTQPRLVLLAADLPLVTSIDVERLLTALDDPVSAVVGSMLVDGEGRDQPLLSAWHTAELRRVLPPEPAGAGLRQVLAALPVRRLPGGYESLDCDTAADVERAREVEASIQRRRGAGSRTSGEQRWGRTWP